MKRLLTGEATEPNSEEQQKATLEGVDAQENLTSTRERQHQRVTRYMVFDMVDVDGNGKLENVVYWVLHDHKILLRFRRLSEQYPSRIPRRPFAESSFLPVKGRRVGIGMLELGEGLHDLRKTTMDQMVNLNTLLLSPFFFYRPSSSMNDEVIKIWPGEGYPLSDPSKDVHFPQLPHQGASLALNTIAVLDRDWERLSVVGDMQYGRVPTGKSSALRTAGGMAMINAQGDERPTRILRRFFSGLAQVWSLMHKLNRSFLPPKKAIRVATPLEQGEDAYINVSQEDFQGIYDFEFTANAFNTSQVAMQESLREIAGLVISPVAFQAGVSNEQTVYKLIEQWVKAHGMEPEEVGIVAPQGMPSITIEEAILAIRSNRLPQGVPAEGPMIHLMGLQMFMDSEAIGLLEVNQVGLLQQWMKIVTAYAQQQAQRQAAAASAAEQQQGGAGTQQVSPPGVNPQEQAPVQGTELLDETMPSAGGGAAPI